MKKQKKIRQPKVRQTVGSDSLASLPLRRHVAYLLRGRGAHVSFERAMKEWPVSCRAKRVPGLPHTPWMLLEHLRIAQWDILEFSRNPSHVSPQFPKGYWPQAQSPPHRNAWSRSLATFMRDLDSMEALVTDPAVDLTAPISHGNGQTILREALLVADHNAYHLGQLVMLRRLLIQ